MPTEKGKDYRHPSYAVIGISKAQCGPPGATLFDSPFYHQNVINLRISHAVKRRDLHRDWIHGEERIIEVMMSEAQFATMITSPNQGEGVPCTLNHVNGRSVERPKVDNVKKTYSNEIKEELKDICAQAKELHDLTNLKNPKADERNRMRELSRQIFQAFHDNLAFFQRQFAEKMTDVVAAARAEIEAHVNSVIQRTGIEQLRKEVPRMEDPSQGKIDG